MKGVILAGGEGTRLRPLTTHIPKPLINIAGKPCIGYVIESLLSANINDIIITTGYLSDKLMKGIAINDFKSASILYSFEGTPKGTAGAVKILEDYLDSTFIVASGDVLSKINVNEFLKFHRSKEADITIALTEVKNPEEYGIVELDSDNAIVKFKEKPKKEEQFSNLINTGIYIIEPRVLKEIPVSKPFDFSKQLFPELLRKKYRLYGWKMLSDLWRDIGRPEDLLKATFDILDKDNHANADKRDRVKLESIIGEPVYIGNNVNIMNTVKIVKSAIYDDVAIDERSSIENSIIFYRAKVGEDAVIESSIIAEDCLVENNAVIKNSVIGNGITIKKGSIINNARISS
ncbi:MAG: NDP-sugar synthase [Candidatus Thermoplasmatota archaeon]|nr:NDP-sugar synthase [Candidatus Thermoplasmatota archaeon]MCL5963681.1 NDP-sugar synthase [Candidatus Thermoplasmatota archaeon]